jgi:hypothetical protein
MHMLWLSESSEKNERRYTRVIHRFLRGMGRRLFGRRRLRGCKKLVNRAKIGKAFLVVKHVQPYYKPTNAKSIIMSNVTIHFVKDADCVSQTAKLESTHGCLDVVKTDCFESLFFFFLLL